MLNSLSCMLFGATEQACQDKGQGHTDTDLSQVNKAADLDLKDEEMGWTLVDLLETGGSVQPPSPSQDKDMSLRGPDGGLFEGVLDLYSSCSSISEDEETAENNINNVLLNRSSSCSSISDDSFEENYAELLGSPTFCSCDTCKETEKRNSSYKFWQQEESKIFEMDDGWTVTPPPCFMGTDISQQLESNPFENKLIEYTSMYACLMLSNDMPNCQVCGNPHVSGSCEDIEFVSHVFGASRDVRKKVGRSFREDVPYSRSKSSAALGKMSKANSHSVYSGSGSRVVQLPSRSVAIATECVGAIFQKKQSRFQQRCEKAAAKKYLSRSYIERSNKARSVQSSSHKSSSARCRLLRPSGSKCGRFCQRAP